MLAAVALLFLFQNSDYSAEGMKALEAQKYDAAIDMFGKAIAADPKDYAAHFHLGLTYSLLVRDDEAITQYRKVLELQPGLYQAELNLGIVLLRSKRPAEAIVPLKSAAEQKPKEYRARYTYAEALFEAGEFAQAEREYAAAAELDPKPDAAVAGRARSLLRLGRMDESEAAFRRAGEIDPASRSAILELATKYQETKQTEKAIRIYQEFPENIAVQERLGALLLESGRFPEAIARLEATVQKDPTPANKLALATAYRMNKQMDKSLPLLQQVVAADPDNFDLRLNYGRALRDQKLYQLAAVEFHRSVKLKPESRAAWNELSAMLTLLEAYPQAIAALDKARSLGETTPGNDYFRAIVLDKMHQYKPALEAYNRFLATSEQKFPDEEFKARQRIKVIQKELSKR